MESLNLFELGLLQGLQEAVGCPLLNKITVAISTTGDKGIGMILLALALLCIPKTRKVGAVVAVALVLDVVLVNLCLKPLVARTRPYDLGIDLNLITPHPSDYSFPSGHTAAAFAGAVALYTAGKKWMGIGLCYACCMGFCRMYLMMHYPTDVFFGALAGAVCGIAAIWLWNCMEAVWLPRLNQNKR